VRIGILGDTHDRVPAVRALMQRLGEAGAAMVLHTGDYCAPFTVRAMQEAHLPVLGVFGHNDGDHDGLRAAAATGIGCELFEAPHSVEIGGVQLLLVHDLNDVDAGGLTRHQIVVHGGTHVAGMKERAGTLLVNPGEACGWLHGEPTAALLDLETRVVEFVKLTGPEWTNA
jgi:putative phosphoesterase